MKNLLLASTALVAFAGAAAAEVTVSGQGRFGVTAANGGDAFVIRTASGVGPAGNISLEDGATVAFSSRLRVIFGMSFESDSGLTFGGSTRADNAAGANKGTAGSVFVSGDFGKLQVGDVDSAAEAAVGNISGVGYTGNGDYNETLYLLSGGGDPFANDELSLAARPAALYTYSTGGASFYVGIGNPAGKTITSNGLIIPIVGSAQTDSQYSVGVEWANEQFSVGAGYESAQIYTLPTAANTNTFEETYGAFYLGGSATFGGATIKAIYGDISDLDYTQYGMSIDYTFDAFTATAFFRSRDYDQRVIKVGGVDTQLGTQTAYGIGGTYDLGGGVLIKGGVTDPDISNFESVTGRNNSVYYQADLGVTFNF